MFEKILTPCVLSPGSQERIRVTPETPEKFEIVSGRATWDQEKLLDGKRPETKKLVTLSLSDHYRYHTGLKYYI
jgi:hypothetical protein